VKVRRVMNQTYLRNTVVEFGIEIEIGRMGKRRGFITFGFYYRGIGSHSFLSSKRWDGNKVHIR
jgi:hypothetical protein